MRELMWELMRELMWELMFDWRDFVGRMRELMQEPMLDWRDFVGKMRELMMDWEKDFVRSWLNGLSYNLQGTVFFLFLFPKKVKIGDWPVPFH